MFTRRAARASALALGLVPALASAPAGPGFAAGVRAAEAVDAQAGVYTSAFAGFFLVELIEDDL